MGVAEIFAAIKAIPKLVEAIESVASSISKLRDAQLEKELSAAKEELNEIIRKLPQESNTKDQLLAMVRRLNKL